MKVFKIHTIAMVLALVTTAVFAQTKTDAVKLYNAGLEQAGNNNYEQAIASLTQALTVANQLGPEGEDIKNRAEKQIPTVYFRKAAANYKAFQKSKSLTDLDSAIDAFKEAVEVGNEYNDKRVTPKAEGIIPQLYYQKSVMYYSKNEYEKANDAVDEALNLNSNYATAYYQKAKIFKKENDTDGDGIIDQNIDELLTWYDRAIEVADKTKQKDVSDAAREAAYEELVAVGTNQSAGGNVSDAIETLHKALNYDDAGANAYYRLAEAYNKAGNAKNAIKNAKSALQYENGGKTDKAKIYYELGFAHQTLGNKSEACDAFTNALYGSFKSPAQHKMEYELKCDSSAP
jgi:tetratricopeptide (TPR) repeat protein